MGLHLERQDAAERARRLTALFEQIDADADGAITTAEARRLLDAHADAQEVEALMLFFEHLDSGVDCAAGAGSVGKGDRRIVLDEWVRGLLDTMGARTDAELADFCDGFAAKLRAQ